jgi:hypothetical protein
MNEPSNLDTNSDISVLKCPQSNLEDPAYRPLAARQYDDENSLGPKTKISDKTICMISLQGEKDEYTHYNVHNLYGLNQIEPTYEYFLLLNN